VTNRCREGSMRVWKDRPSPMIAPGRLRKMPSVGMDSRQGNPKEAGGKNSIRIDRVRIVVRKDLFHEDFRADSIMG